MFDKTMIAPAVIGIIPPALGGQSADFAFLSPPVFNLGGHVLIRQGLPDASSVQLDNGYRKLTETAVAHRLEESIGDVYLSMANSRGYFLPWRKEIGDVNVAMEIPCLARFLREDPAWKKVIAEHDGGVRFMAISRTRPQRTITAAVTAVTPDEKGYEPIKLSQTTELELSAERMIIGGGTVLMLRGSDSLLEALISAGILDVPLDTPLHKALFPLATYILRQGGVNLLNWDLVEGGRTTHLVPENGSLKDPKDDSERRPGLSYSLASLSGKVMLGYVYVDKGFAEGPYGLSYPIPGGYTFYVGEILPREVDRPFSPGIRNIVRAAADSVFAGAKLAILGQ